MSDTHGYESLEDEDAAEAAAAAAAEKRAIAEADDFVKALATREGRRLAWSMLSDCRVGESTYVPGGDVNAMLFRAGEVNVGLRWIARLMSVAPHAWAQMQKEAGDAGW